MMNGNIAIALIIAVIGGAFWAYDIINNVAEYVKTKRTEIRRREESEIAYDELVARFFEGNN